MRAWPARNPNTISGGEPTIAWSRVGGEPTQCTRLGNCKELITAMTSMDSTLLVVNLRITLQRHGDGSFDRAEGACWNITSPTQFDPMGSSSSCSAPYYTQQVSDPMDILAQAWLAYFWRLLALLRAGRQIQIGTGRRAAYRFRLVSD